MLTVLCVALTGHQFALCKICAQSHLTVAGHNCTNCDCQVTNMVMMCNRFKLGQANSESKHQELHDIAAVHEAKVPKAAVQEPKMHTADRFELISLSCIKAQACSYLGGIIDFRFPHKQFPVASQAQQQISQSQQLDNVASVTAVCANSAMHYMPLYC